MITTYQKIHNFVLENEELLQTSREFAMNTILVDSLLAEKLGISIDETLSNLKSKIENGEPLRTAIRDLTINKGANLGKAA